MAERVLSVTQLNEYVNGLLSFDPMLRRISIRGEISGFKRHSSGHLYFALKDEESLIRCVCFRQQGITLPFQPCDGMRVVAGGNVALYARDGAYQFYVKTLTKDGVGDLFVRFEELKARLLGEGLFDEAYKRPLPLVPRCIGVVTSRTGSVIQDIERVAHRRFPNMKLLLAPAKVQGEGAAEDIARAITRLAKSGEADVIIIGRGGGSIEELWAFNEEIVARAIYDCPVPVISAVGHETDFTIADLVADVRASTPSVAAEIATPLKRDLQKALLQSHRRMCALVQDALFERRHKLKNLADSHVMRGVTARLEAAKERLDRLLERLYREEEAVVRNKRLALGAGVAKLEELSPLAVLSRGYAIARKGRCLLKTAQGVKRGDKIRVTLRDGEICADVTEIVLGE